MQRPLALVALCLAGLAMALNTPQPPAGVPTLPSSSGGGHPDPTLHTAECMDNIENCIVFGEDSCKAPYEQWAKKNCALTCKYCTAPPTSPPPCVDKLENCQGYNASVCKDPKFLLWATQNCRRRCRMCTAEQLDIIDNHPSTIAPSMCVDKLDCRLYGKSSCEGTFEMWAKDNCPLYCGFCKGVPKPPPKCLNKNPDCSRYDKAMCTNPEYHIWAEDNCNKLCGFCDDSSSHTGLHTPPPLVVKTTQGFATPPPLGPHIG